MGFIQVLTPETTMWLRTIAKTGSHTIIYWYFYFSFLLLLWAYSYWILLEDGLFWWLEISISTNVLNLAIHSEMYTRKWFQVASAGTCLGNFLVGVGFLCKVLNTQHTLSPNLFIIWKQFHLLDLSIYTWILSGLWSNESAHCHICVSWHTGLFFTLYSINSFSCILPICSSNCPVNPFTTTKVTRQQTKWFVNRYLLYSSQWV